MSSSSNSDIESSQQSARKRYKKRRRGCETTCCDTLVSQLGVPDPATANLYTTLTTIVNNLIPPPAPPGVAIAIKPRHTRFVSPNWHDSNPPTDWYFTDIPSAIAAILAETPIPTKDDQYQIYLYPGVYGDTTETLQLISNINISGIERRDTLLNYAVNWDVGQGVNAGAIGGTEQVCLRGLTLNNGYTQSVNPGKASGTTSTAQLFDIEIRNGDINTTCRIGIDDDHIQVFNSLVFPGNATFNAGGNINFYSCFFYTGTLTVQSTAIDTIFFTVESNEIGPAVYQFINAFVSMCNVIIYNPIVATGASIINLVNCSIDDTSTMSIDTNCIAYLMGSEYDPVFLSGTGRADRSMTAMSVTVPGGGSAAATFATPYYSTIYVVVATPTTAGAGALVVSAKTETGFNYTGTPGATYDIMVLLAQSYFSIE
jgi:hypothetical protein